MGNDQTPQEEQSDRKEWILVKSENGGRGAGDHLSPLMFSCKYVSGTSFLLELLPVLVACN